MNTTLIISHKQSIINRNDKILLSITKYGSTIARFYNDALMNRSRWQRLIYGIGMIDLFDSQLGFSIIHRFYGFRNNIFNDTK